MKFYEGDTLTVIKVGALETGWDDCGGFILTQIITLQNQKGEVHEMRMEVNPEDYDC